MITDDLDGQPAVETVSFALDGAAYEIDLSEKNAAHLRKGVARFVENARRIRPAAPSAAGRRSSRGTTSPARR